MIDHETARRSFATSLDFTLEPAEQEALDAHLAGCPSCRAFATSLRSDAAIIRDLETGPVPVAVRANVAIAAEHGRRSNPVGRWVGIAVFAALLLGVRRCRSAGRRRARGIGRARTIQRRGRGRAGADRLGHQGRRLERARLRDRRPRQDIPCGDTDRGRDVGPRHADLPDARGDLEGERRRDASEHLLHR